MLEINNNRFSQIGSQYQYQKYGHSSRRSVEIGLPHDLDKVSLNARMQRTEITYNSSLQIQNLEDAGYSQLRNYVSLLLKKQGVETRVRIGDQEIDLEQVDVEQAAGLISEDGYFGVEQTSDRIVDFSIALTGNDPERIDAVREGIEKGFNEALDAFGGWLPEISYKTYDAVQEKLDDWVSSAAG